MSEDVVKSKRPKDTPKPPSQPKGFSSRLAPEAVVEHRDCGTRFPRSEACPRCKRKLLEG